ncbi:MAG: hypothetical protein IJB90_03000, partial [Clostridia bacterium]|nr:hypothetical protein [Clostridia bacterium]
VGATIGRPSFEERAIKKIAPTSWDNSFDAFRVAVGSDPYRFKNEFIHTNYNLFFRNFRKF